MEVTKHNETDIWTEKEFSLALALIYWFSAAVSGIMVLGFSEVIKLLEDIKNK